MAKRGPQRPNAAQQDFLSARRPTVQPQQQVGKPNQFSASGANTQPPASASAGMSASGASSIPTASAAGASASPTSLGMEPTGSSMMRRGGPVQKFAAGGATETDQYGSWGGANAANAVAGGAYTAPSGSASPVGGSAYAAPPSSAAAQPFSTTAYTSPPSSAAAQPFSTTAYTSPVPSTASSSATAAPSYGQTSSGAGGFVGGAGQGSVAGGSKYGIGYFGGNPGAPGYTQRGQSMGMSAAARGGSIPPLMNKFAAGGSVAEEPYRNKWKAKNHPGDSAYKFDDGGDVPSGGDVPDPGGAMPSDPSDPGAMQDTSAGDPGQAGDMSASLQAVQGAYQYGMQQLAGNIPSAPAGPGGDQTQGGPQDRGNQQVASNLAVPPGSQSPANGPSQWTGQGLGTPQPNVLQPTPGQFNPRDYLPGGKKASDAGQGTVSAVRGGSIPSFAGGGGVPEVWSTNVLGENRRKSYAPGGAVSTPTVSGTPSAAVATANAPVQSQTQQTQDQLDQENAAQAQQIQANKLAQRAGAQNRQGQSLTQQAGYVPQYAPGGGVMPPQPQVGPPPGPGGVGGAPPNIMRYLTGADATPVQQVLRHQKSQDPRIPPHARTAHTIASAGGPAQQFAALQAFRKLSDTAGIHAKTAITGAGQHPPSLQHAVAFANKKFEYAPTPHHVQFSLKGKGAPTQGAFRGGSIQSFDDGGDAGPDVGMSSGGGGVMDEGQQQVADLQNNPMAQMSGAGAPITMTVDGQSTDISPQQLGGMSGLSFDDLMQNAQQAIQKGMAVPTTGNARSLPDVSQQAQEGSEFSPGAGYPQTPNTGKLQPENYWDVSGNADVKPGQQGSGGSGGPTIRPSDASPSPDMNKSSGTPVGPVTSSAMKAADDDPRGGEGPAQAGEQDSKPTQGAQQGSGGPQDQVSQDRNLANALHNTRMKDYETPQEFNNRIRAEQGYNNPNPMNLSAAQRKEIPGTTIDKLGVRHVTDINEYTKPTPSQFDTSSQNPDKGDKPYSSRAGTPQSADATPPDRPAYNGPIHVVRGPSIQVPQSVDMGGTQNQQPQQSASQQPQQSAPQRRPTQQRPTQQRTSRGSHKGRKHSALDQGNSMSAARGGSIPSKPRRVYGHGHAGLGTYQEMPSGEAQFLGPQRLTG